MYEEVRKLEQAQMGILQGYSAYGIPTYPKYNVLCLFLYAQMPG